MANTYLKRTNGSPTNDKIGTISVWVKRSKLSSDQRIHMNFADGNNYATFYFVSSDEIELYAVTSGSQSTQVRTTRKFRDTSAWYHIVLAVDTTQGTTTDRIKMYVNGVQETSFSQTDYFGQNESCPLFIASGSNYHTVGSAENGTATFDGSMSHYHKCDGTALAPTVFGETDSTTGEWKIKTNASFTPGNNGYTILKDGNTITDQSANSNDFTLGAGTLTKTEDCPSNVFATWNPLAKLNTTISLIYGNTTSSTTTGTWKSLTGTIGASTGKYYFEGKTEVSNYGVLGIVNDKLINSTTDGGFAFTNKWSYGYKMYNGTLVYYEGDGGGNQSSYGSSLSTGQVLGVAVDLDNSKLYFSINGVWQNSGDPTSGSTGTGAFSIQSGETYVPAISQLASSGNPMLHLNFGNGYFGSTQISSAGTNASGNGIFEYDVPTGYSALSTKGLNT